MERPCYQFLPDPILPRVLDVADLPPEVCGRVVAYGGDMKR